MPQPYEETSKRVYMAELLNDASIDCVIAMDTSQTITSWNKACEHHTGILKVAVLGQKLANILPELSSSKAMTLAIGHALEGLKSFVPVQAVPLVGEYMESHVIPLKDEQEQVVGIMIVRHDVAHRQKAEQELKRLNTALAQKARESDQRNADLIAFARVTSHDLKEPLYKIRSFTRMLLEREHHQLSENGTSLITRIQKSARRAEMLTDDIFSFWQIQKPSDTVAEVDLASVIRMTLHHLSQKITETAAIIETVKLPVITGYSTQLYQLFQHIIDNGLKFQQRGSVPRITIETGNAKGAELSHPDAMEESGYAWVSFRDNGIGFDRAYADRIFDVFLRLNSSDEYPGNGIGLSLCKKIMELHHGFMVADSKENKGCIVTCYFPI